MTERTRRQFLILTGAAAATLAGCADEVAGTTPDAALPDDAGASFDDLPFVDDLPAIDVAPAEDTPAVEDVPPAEDTPSVDAGEDVPAADTGADVPSMNTRADAGADAGTDAPPGDAGGLPDPTQLYPEDARAFPIGVMAGDMTSERAVLWTRMVGGGPVTVRVYEMEGRAFASIVREVMTTTDPDGFVHYDLTGLRPGRWYRYVFLRRDGERVSGRSAVGRFRTAIADDALEVVTIGGVSCTTERFGPFPTLVNAGRRTDLDAFVHVGDMVYCDGSRTVDQFRAKYAANYGSAGYRALLSSTGFYSTWDDHEVDNNWNPETINATTLANAKRAFFEHRAMRRDPVDRDRIWRSHRWGRTLEIFMLDCRGERRPSTRSGSNAQYVSRAQLDWLKAGLMRSTAMFKMVMNSVPVTDFPITMLGGEDHWEGYGAQRRELLDFIVNNRVSNVWWVSGDFHYGAVTKLAASGAHSAMREVMVGPGGQVPNPLFLILNGPQVDYVTGENNYGVLRCDPVARMLTVSFVDGNGREIFSRRYPVS